MKKMLVMAGVVLFSTAAMAQTQTKPKKQPKGDSAWVKKDSMRTPKDTSSWKTKKKPMRSAPRPAGDSALTMPLRDSI